jgi:hypothetical protein
VRWKSTAQIGFSGSRDSSDRSFRGLAGDTELDRALKETSALDARRKQTAAEVAELESRAPNETAKLSELQRRLRLEKQNWEFYLKSLFDAARSKAAKARD